MNPQSVLKLRENIPELRELIQFLASELAKLNTLDGVAAADSEDMVIAREVRARLIAHHTLQEMLSPLLMETDKTVGVDPSEFVV